MRAHRLQRVSTEEGIVHRRVVWNSHWPNASMVKSEGTHLVVAVVVVIVTVVVVVVAVVASSDVVARCDDGNSVDSFFFKFLVVVDVVVVVLVVVVVVAGLVLLVVVRCLVGGDVAVGEELQVTQAAATRRRRVWPVRRAPLARWDPARGDHGWSLSCFSCCWWCSGCCSCRCWWRSCFSCCWWCCSCRCWWRSCFSCCWWCSSCRCWWRSCFSCCCSCRYWWRSRVSGCCCRFGRRPGRRLGRRLGLKHIRGQVRLRHVFEPSRRHPHLVCRALGVPLEPPGGLSDGGVLGLQRRDLRREPLLAKGLLRRHRGCIWMCRSKRWRRPRPRRWPRR